MEETCLYTRNINSSCVLLIKINLKNTIYDFVSIILYQKQVAFLFSVSQYSSYSMSSNKDDRKTALIAKIKNINKNDVNIPLITFVLI